MKKIIIDPVWEKKYQAGHQERYPWDVVVSFVYRNRPRDIPANQVKILEVGFGTGNNLWFAAREGFSVAGIEGSETAVKQARQRFEAEGLEGDLRFGDFTALPFESNKFDLAIDRGALCCVGRTRIVQAIREVCRCLKLGVKFLVQGYADSHTSFFNARGADGVRGRYFFRFA